MAQIPPQRGAARIPLGWREALAQKSEVTGFEVYVEDAGPGLAVPGTGFGLGVFGEVRGLRGQELLMLSSVLLRESRV